jgi:hypothetical protein
VRCDVLTATTLDEQFPASGRHYSPLKLQQLLTQQHSITSQKTRISASRIKTTNPSNTMLYSLLASTLQTHLLPPRSIFNLQYGGSKCLKKSLTSPHGVTIPEDSAHHCCENLKIDLKLHSKKNIKFMSKKPLRLDILNHTTEACAAATSETWFQSKPEYWI